MENTESATKPGLWIVKIGGNVVDEAAILGSVLGALAAHPEPLILVHGGGKLATRLAGQLGVPQTMVDGRRVTDAATLDIALMVYAGLINKKIVAELQAAGCNALGLSGADGNSLRAVKRPATPINFGLVGDTGAEGVNAAFLNLLLQNRIAPVFSALTHDGAGQLLNTNADTLAQAIAVAMSRQYDIRLLYLFEKKGVLSDVADEASLLAEIRLNEVEALIEQRVIQAGMIPKIRNAAAAVGQGVASVLIGQPEQLQNILQHKTDACTRVIA
jgi:acetylglutamate kinase